MHQRSNGGRKFSGKNHRVHPRNFATAQRGGYRL